jgi:hypothetical protein
MAPRYCFRCKTRWASQGIYCPRCAFDVRQDTLTAMGQAPAVAAAVADQRPVVAGTCDRCGPAVAAVTVWVTQGLAVLTLCGHHARKHGPKLVMQGFALEESDA